MLVLNPESVSLKNNNSTYIDLCFPVIGEMLPADHGYGLYSALTHWNESIHALEGLSIQTITGIPDKQGKIYLTERSQFRMRLPHEQIPLVYGLAGKALTIGKHTIRLGIPQIDLLQPSANLKARIVVIKGYQEPESFLEAAQRQLTDLGINGLVKIPIIQTESSRKTIKIKRFTVVGFGLEIGDLNDEDSLLLQKIGLGGKRRMGCGVFIPTKEES
jgi:CRISPR-associated protein Cas6